MTHMLEDAIAGKPDREEVLKYLGQDAALKLVAQPIEVVQGMLFACDKENSYMTSHELLIDGGATRV